MHADARILIAHWTADSTGGDLDSIPPIWTEMNNPMADLQWVAFQRGMHKSAEAAGKLNDLATNYDLTTWQQSTVTDVQKFYSLYDATAANGMRDLMELPSGTLATLTQNSLNEDTPLGVYSKSWLKFAQNELYLPEHIMYQPSGNKTNERSVFELRDVEEKLRVDIYPNPAKNYFTVDIAEYEVKRALKIELLNSVGTIVEFRNSVNLGITQINTNHLPTGIYVVRITDGNEVIQNKVLEIIR